MLLRTVYKIQSAILYNYHIKTHAIVYYSYNSICYFFNLSAVLQSVELSLLSFYVIALKHHAACAMYNGIIRNASAGLSVLRSFLSDA